MASQYPLAFAAALQLKVGVLPVNVEPGVGDCMTAKPAVPFAAAV
jgi:hypothetical protein